MDIKRVKEHFFLDKPIQQAKIPNNMEPLLTVKKLNALIEKLTEK